MASRSNGPEPEATACSVLPGRNRFHVSSNMRKSRPRGRTLHRLSLGAPGDATRDRGLTLGAGIALQPAQPASAVLLSLCRRSRVRLSPQPDLLVPVGTLQRTPAAEPPTARERSQTPHQPHSPKIRTHRPALVLHNSAKPTAVPSPTAHWKQKRRFSDRGREVGPLPLRTRKLPRRFHNLL